MIRLILATPFLLVGMAASAIATLQLPLAFVFVLTGADFLGTLGSAIGNTIVWLIVMVVSGGMGLLLRGGAR